MKFIIFFLCVSCTNIPLVNAAHSSSSSSVPTLPNSALAMPRPLSVISSDPDIPILTQAHSETDETEPGLKNTAHEFDGTSLLPVLNIYPSTPISFLNRNSQVLLVEKEASEKIFNALKNGHQQFPYPSIQPTDSSTIHTKRCLNCDFRIVLTNLIRNDYAFKRRHETKKATH